jgi:hypothetical protein
MGEKQRDDEQSPREGLSRRQVLRGGAAVTGAGLLWVAPVVSGVGLTAAHADPASGRPGGVDPTVQGITITKNPPTQTLPFTGSGIPIEAAAAVAGGLVAVGGAAYAGAKIRKRKAENGEAGSDLGVDFSGGPEPEPPVA